MPVKIIHVVPIGRRTGIETLSYFSTKKFERGSVIRVPLKKKNIPALVVSSEEVETIKSDLKSRSYSMRKIEKGSGRQLMLPAYIKAVEKTAQFFATPMGKTLYYLFPHSILENQSAPEIMLPPASENKKRSEVFVLHTHDE